MKAALLLVSALALAHATVVPTHGHVKAADDGWMVKQTKVVELLSWGKMEEPYENEFYHWDIEHQEESFTNKDVYYYFLKQYRDGFIPRDSTHSLYNPKYFNETVTLFDLFYYAKDFDTFYKCASWARKHVNFVTFTFAFSTAVYNRDDCHGITIPPFYEILPYYFIHADLLHKSYNAKMHGQHTWKKQLNYTGYDYNYHSDYYGGVLKNWVEGEKYEEYKLSYFREDVVLNDLYARWHMYYPNWFNFEKYGVEEWHKFGETFYYFHQQLLARYILERYANELPNIEFLEWEKPIKTGYNPNIVDMNGNPLFARPDYYNLKDFYPYGVWKAEGLERKIFDAIDTKYFLYYNNSMKSYMDFEGTDILGKAIYGAKDTVHPYYGTYFYEGLRALAYAVHTESDKNFLYGATGLSLTSLRDPAFFAFLHRMVSIFQHYKDQLPYYTPKELYYPGVKIENFEFDKLVTFFDWFEFDTTYALSMAKSEPKQDYHYYVKQLRLDHKPFSYKLTVSSDKAADAMVRVFIGPKYDSNGRELTLEQARMAYFEFDRFPVKMTPGQNIFERSSKDSTVFVSDLTTVRTFKEYVTKYTTKYPNVPQSHYCGFPEHFQLPKGEKFGREYVFYAIVTPFEGKHLHSSEERYFEAFVPCGGQKFYDYKPYGFPFDRQVYYEEYFQQADNMYFKYVPIYHKDDKDFFYHTTE